MTNANSSNVGIAARAFGAGIMYAVGVVIGGVAATAAHLSQPSFPPPASPGPFFLIMVVLSGVMGIVLAPLIRGIGGSLFVRAASIALLVFVCWGVNTTLELTIFSTFLKNGGILAQLLAPLIGAMVFAPTAAALIPKSESVEAVREAVSNRSVAEWAGRIALAILAFPAIYFVVGLAIAPIVVDIYHAGVPGYLIPSPAAIIKMQFVRGTLFLLACTPVLVLWRKSRGQLVLALGLALSWLVGLYGLLQADAMPPTLRWTHSVEIAVDSFAYAFVLVYLLKPKGTASASVPHEQPKAA